MLDAPVMMASGTAGYGIEMAPFVNLASLGAVVTKSLAPFEWAGNPAPRIHPTTQGMINAVGLQGPGVEHWLVNVLPPLVDTGATVVCSIWGRSLADYQVAAEMLADAPPEVVAVEVNLSCPNLEGRGAIFAHDIELSAAVMAATAGCNRPRWAKLSANTDRIIEVAAAVHDAGAEAVTCVNTLLGLAYDPDSLPRRWASEGAGIPVGPFIPWRCGRCMTCTRRCPTFRSSASGEWRQAGTLSRCFWRGRRLCRSELRRLRTLGLLQTSSVSWSTGLRSGESPALRISAR